MADKPQWRLIRKNPNGKWDYIGAAWNRDNGGFSIVIELERGGEKIKALLVENKDKEAGKLSEHVQKEVEKTINELNDELPF